MSDPLDAETYEHLRAIARRITSERNATIQPTALLHEAWEQLDKSSTRWESKRHFMAVAAKAMRQVVIKRGQAKATQKRGGGAVRATLTGVGAPDAAIDLLELDDALKKLEAFDAPAAEVAVMRVFGGLTTAEVAQEMALSERTVARHWRFALSFLRRSMEG